MPVRIDEIESDIELQGDSAPDADADSADAAWRNAEQVGELIDQRVRDEQRTRARDFDD